MLGKIKNQEEVVVVLFVSALVSFGLVILFTRKLVDVGYMGLLIFYYMGFLRIRNNGGSR